MSARDELANDIRLLMSHLDSAIEDVKLGRPDPFCDECSKLLNRLASLAAGRIDDGHA